MPLWDAVGDIAIVEIERVSPLLGKMLGAAMGGTVGIGAYKYLEPHRAGKGFDRSKGSARNAGIAAGRAIAGGNLERVHQTRGISKDAVGSNRFNQKYRPVQHSGRYCKCGKHTTRVRCKSCRHRRN